MTHIKPEWLMERYQQVTQERDVLRAENERLEKQLRAAQMGWEAAKRTESVYWDKCRALEMTTGPAELESQRQANAILTDEADALRQRVAALEEGILAEIMGEVSRAVRKFPTWPTDPLHAVAVIGEEFGELTKAALELTYEPHKTSADEVRKEAVQTAAMALRFVLSLDRYEYKPGEQHAQDARALLSGAAPTK